jgi:very-short-patch-repair endonuclease
MDTPTRPPPPAAPPARLAPSRPPPMREAERRLWRRLCAPRFAGRFQRRVRIGPCLADFAAWRPRLVIQLAPGPPPGPPALRFGDAALCARGFRVLRFWDNALLHDPGPVLMAIERALLEAHAAAACLPALPLGPRA